MKGLLTKRGDNYVLFVGDAPFASTMKDPYKNLSKQNCDEIFGVVDVEELAEAKYPSEVGYAVSDSNFRIGELQDAYIKGFNKVLELNKDKVFTLEDVKSAILFGQGMELWKEEEQIDKFIQTLQQPKAIEIEIEMGKVVEETNVIGAVKSVKGSGDKITTYKSIPTLDSEGNLILKKI
jgi:hypothetical protein